MPGQGFPPQPTALKILRGNPGRRPLNKKEPKALVGKPPFPEWLAALDPVTKEIYESLAHRLVKTKVLTENELESLAHLADSEALYRRLRVEIQAGFVYETTTMQGAVMRRPKPEMAMLLDLKRQIRQGLMDFGLTPSSRTKVQTVEDAQKDPLEEFIGSGT
jgi:P27 family predicted phage terminase small subunit